MEIDLNRSNHLIDPHLHIWGWEIPVYLFLGGITAGIMIFSVLLRKGRHEDDQSRWLRLLPFAAPVILSLGMVALLLDLEYKIHLWRFYTAFKWTSPMSWGSWILVFIYPVTLMFALAGLTPKEVEAAAGRPLVKGLLLSPLLRLGYEKSRAWEKALGRLSIALGIGLGVYTGILLGTLGARPLWHSALLGPLFLVSGLSTGAAFMMLFPLEQTAHHRLLRWDLMLIGVELCLIVIYFLDLSSGGQAGRQAAAMLLGGEFTAAFWSLVVIAGLIVPFVVEMIEARRQWAPTRFAPLLLLVGGFSLRWVLVAAGQV